MKSQINKVFYFKENKLISRVVNLFRFKENKDDCVFNIDMRRSIFVHNSDTRCCDKKSFFNNRPLIKVDDLIKMTTLCDEVSLTKKIALINIIV